MTINKNIIAWIALVVAVLSAILGVLKAQPGAATPTGTASGSGVPTVYDNMNLLGSFQSGVTANNALSQTNYGAGSVYAGGGLYDGGNITVTVTGVAPASTTLTQTQLMSNYVTVVHNTGPATLFLPASSTLSTFLPNTGDCTQSYYFNATTSINQYISLSPGTGTLVEVASSTATSAVGSTSPSRAMTVDICRKLDTDLIFMVNPYN